MRACPAELEGGLHATTLELDAADGRPGSTVVAGVEHLAGFLDVVQSFLDGG